MGCAQDASKMGALTEVVRVDPRCQTGFSSILFFCDPGKACRDAGKPALQEQL